MKAITLTQPWATLVAIAARWPHLGKGIETRGWRTNHRGPLAIHAGQGLGPVGGVAGLRALVRCEPFCTTFGTYDAWWGTDILNDPSYYLPRGSIVATCDLVDCQMIGVLPSGDPAYMAYDEFPPMLAAVQEPERSFGLYTAGRYAWLLSDIRALPEPIPCKGALSLWECEL